MEACAILSTIIGNEAWSSRLRLMASAFVNTSARKVGAPSRAWSMGLEVGGALRLRLEAEGRLRISDCETGNPPEGWKSEGQLRIADLNKQRGDGEMRRKTTEDRGQKTEAVGLISENREQFTVYGISSPPRKMKTYSS